MMPTSTTPRGFSLVELIVSVAIFSIIMLAVMSAYFNLIALDRQARAVNVVVDNLSFAVEAMTRGIRTGTEFQCVATGGNSTTGGCTCFTYMDTNLGKQVTYHLNGTKHTIERYVNNSGNFSCADGSPAIVDPMVTVTNLAFYVRGYGSADDVQPQVLFSLRGTMPADSKGHTTAFAIEEYATQRLFDL